MISKRCAALLFQFVAVTNFVCEYMCHPKAGDKYTRNANAALLNMPQGDGFTGRPNADPCQSFEIGNPEKQEFYSPGYPENYPNNTECFRILEAPPGHIVRLDFRDRFVLEGDCKNDYLEVRDGAHGFNTQIEQHFCGTKFPPMITSSDRHLWLHFRSDDNIEHSGFKAVYEFVPRPPDLKTPERKPCTIHVGGNQGIPKKADIDNKTIEFNMEYGLPTDCLWIIKVKDGWKIQLSFLKFSLERPNDCDSNFVDVFSTNTDIPSRDKIFCGSIADTVTSKSNVMFIRYFAESKASKSTFEALFTAFRESDKSSNECLNDEFNCEDAKCISASLRCNGQVNCHFKWDEEDCDNNINKPLSENHIIIIMVIFSLILSGMCFTFIFNCVKKLIRDHQTIREYIRQSREHQLNELGKQEQFEKKAPKLARSRSNSTQSSSSQRFDAANAMTNTPCYVPGGELLPIIIRNEHSLSANTNGDAYNQTVRAYDNESTPQPEMCDSACQTRESLFTTHAYSSEHSTPNHSITSTHSKPSPPAPFSTFGYKKENKYRAEAKIEVEKVEPKAKYEEKRRPYSVQTTKSAPDVIVTH